MPVNTRGEILRYPIACTLVNLYLFEDSGDHIAFEPDSFRDEDWPLPIPLGTVFQYTDVTERTLKLATSKGLLPSRTKYIFYDDEPETFIWLFGEEKMQDSS